MAVKWLKANCHKHFEFVLILNFQRWLRSLQPCSGSGTARNHWGFRTQAKFWLLNLDWTRNRRNRRNWKRLSFNKWSFGLSGYKWLPFHNGSTYLVTANSARPTGKVRKTLDYMGLRYGSCMALASGIKGRPGKTWLTGPRPPGFRSTNAVSCRLGLPTCRWRWMANQVTPGFTTINRNQQNPVTVEASWRNCASQGHKERQQSQSIAWNLQHGNDINWDSIEIIEQSPKFGSKYLLSCVLD